MSLRRRFALQIALPTAGIIALVAIALFLVLGRFLEAGAERTLEAAAQRVEVDIEDGDARFELDEDFPAGVRVRLVVDGRVVAATPGFPDLPVALAPGFGVGADQRVLVRTDRDDDVAYALQFATDAAGIRAPLAAYLQALAIILPLAAVVVAWMSAGTAGRLLAPIQRLERAASAVSGSADLRKPLPGAADRDELGRLATTLQATFTRLADAVDREQAFTRAAAHDLRSPLAALRTRIQSTLARPRGEETYRTTLRELDRDVSRLASLTDHLLVLARDGGSMDAQPTDLVALTGDAVDRARARHPGVLVEYAANASPMVVGDPQLLVHLIDNVLENAAVHGGGADVAVAVAPDRDGGVILRVRDDGPGVAAATLARLGEAFYRPDGSRTAGGSGLGLAIVRRLADLHGAQLRFDSELGQGFSVEVRFPARRPCSGRNHHRG